MGIQDKNLENSIKSKNYPKIKTLRELKNLALIDWCIVIMPMYHTVYLMILGSYLGKFPGGKCLPSKCGGVNSPPTKSGVCSRPLSNEEDCLVSDDDFILASN